MNRARVAHWIAYALAAVTVAAIWTPFGLLAGLITLYLLVLGTTVWVFMDKFHSRALRCSSCSFYETRDEVTGKCSLKQKIAWSNASVCEEFVIKDLAKPSHA